MEFTGRFYHVLCESLSLTPSYAETHCIDAAYVAEKEREMAEKKLTNVISMRLSPGDTQLLDSAASVVPAVPRLTLARIALRIGLEIVRQNPSRAIAGR